MRALIVEDDLICRRVLQKLLAAYGSPVDAVVNGAEALKMVELAHAEGEPYHLICLDIEMPDMTGHQVLMEIRRREDDGNIAADHRARVLMTSGHSQAANVVLSFQNRCDGFLVKPINPEKLAERMRAFGFQALTPSGLSLPSAALTPKTAAQAVVPPSAAIPPPSADSR